MKLRFRVGSKEARKEGRKNGDIEALADAIRALKKRFVICQKSVEVDRFITRS